MRSSNADPAQTVEAKQKRARSLAAQTEAARRWKEANPGPHEREAFVRELLPRLQGVTAARDDAGQRADIRVLLQDQARERVPHPMYWEALRKLSSSSPPR
jgi:hypothetical protein